MHLHGTARALMSDAAGQTTSFNYFNFSSVDASSQHLEAVRPAGPGCTKSDFVNYSPFATIEDNSCVEGRWLQVDMFSASFASTCLCQAYPSAHSCASCYNASQTIYTTTVETSNGSSRHRAVVSWMCAMIGVPGRVPRVSRTIFPHSSAIDRLLE